MIKSIIVQRNFKKYLESRIKGQVSIPWNFWSTLMCIILLGNIWEECWNDNFFSAFLLLYIITQFHLACSFLRVYWVRSFAVSSQCRLPCFGCEGQWSCSWERSHCCREQRSSLQGCAGDHAGGLIFLQRFILFLSGKCTLRFTKWYTSTLAGILFNSICYSHSE